MLRVKAEVILLNLVTLDLFLRMLDYPESALTSDTFGRRTSLTKELNTSPIRDLPLERHDRPSVLDEAVQWCRQELDSLTESS